MPKLADLYEDSDDAPAVSSEEEGGEYEKFARAAFPDEDWTPKRLIALKELVMSCMGED
jgi:hypothetical protein